jgi:hypothetical protein
MFLPCVTVRDLSGGMPTPLPDDSLLASFLGVQPTGVKVLAGPTSGSTLLAES